VKTPQSARWIALFVANAPRQLLFLQPQADAVICRVGELGYFLDEP
jgi:hypothetical protein